MEIIGGKAKVVIREEAYTDEEENRIKAKYDALDKEVNGNDELLKQVYCCKDVIIHAI